MRPGPFPSARRSAVSLTYDDGLGCHRELVAPSLSKRRLHGTFFCPANSDDLHRHVDAWRAIAADGHELGNHTCFHPCRARPDRTWLDRTYDLCTYSRKRIDDEILLAARVMKLIDGRDRRAFAATCGETNVGPDGSEESFLDTLRSCSTHVRSGRGGPLPLAPPPLVVGSVSGDRRDAAQVIAEIAPMRASGGWLVVTIHGVGTATVGNHMLVDEHERLLDWVASQAEWLWAGTMSDVGERLSHHHA